MQRWLAEELTTGPELTSPNTVRDYLRIHYAGHEYESFSVLFLDAKHRLIRAEWSVFHLPNIVDGLVYLLSGTLLKSGFAYGYLFRHEGGSY